MALNRGGWYATVNVACKSGKAAAKGMLEVLTTSSTVFTSKALPDGLVFHESLFVCIHELDVLSSLFCISYFWLAFSIAITAITAAGDWTFSPIHCLSPVAVAVARTL